MPDPTTLAFALTYAATLAVAYLMHLGHLAAFTLVLAVAGTIGLLAALRRGPSRPEASTHQVLLTGTEEKIEVHVTHVTGELRL